MVVFDPATWQTHVLPPATVVVVDLIDELSADGPVSMARLAGVLRAELELDPDEPEIRGLLHRLAGIGLLEA